MKPALCSLSALVGRAERDEYDDLLRYCTMVLPW